MKKNNIIIATIACIIAAIVIIFPQIDIITAQQFYTENDRFFPSKMVIPNLIHDTVKYITITVGSTLLILLAINTIKKQNTLNLSNCVITYLLLALIIGPGLVVNTVFKDNWGRARPHQVKEFGGTKNFTPPFIISDQCERNCSFVSGDPSVGFYFFAFAFVSTKHRRKWIIAALTLGTILGVNRVIMGAHFLSDVIFSGFFVYFICLGLYTGMQRYNKNNPTN